MIFFDNDEKDEFFPPFLNSGEVESAKKAIAGYLGTGTRERRQTDLPPVWKLSLDHSVIAALAQWTKGRCAFCERRRSDLIPYRFRPPGYAEPALPPAGKDAYLGLCFAWSNFFPICRDCRPDRPSFFPVSGARANTNVHRDPGLRLREDAGLYFPGELDQPAAKYQLGASGSIIPIGGKAAATVAHFKLNRQELLDERSANLGRFINEIDHISSRSPEEWMEQLLNEEFGGARYLYLRRLMKVVGNFGSVPPPRKLSPAGLREVLLRWRDRIELGPALRTAADTIEHEDSVAASRKLQAAQPPAPSGGFPDARIAAVEIKTYKSLEEIRFELPEELAARSVSQADVSKVRPEAPCLLILGENATGKSSILEAIALACLTPEMVDRLPLQARQMTLDPEYMGSGHPARVMDSEIIVTFHGAAPRRFTVNARPGARQPWRHSPEDEDGPLIFAYGAHRLYGEKGRRVRERHFDTLFRDDRLLSNPEDWLRRLAATDRVALDEVVSALRHIIQIDGEFESIDFPEAGPQQQSGGIIRVRKHRPDGTPFTVSQPLRSVSSGYRAILALVCDVLEGLFDAHGGNPHEARMGRAIILIDEIEAHLHPRWKLQVITGLRQALPRATFIITSHDPLCLRGMFNGEVMALNRYQNVDREGLALDERVEQVDTFENVETMTIEQLLTSDLFQLLSTDDRETEREFARIGDLLAAEATGSFEPHDARILDRFRGEIAAALPFGRSEIPMLVQEAIAEFLKERRTQKAQHASAARQRAKEALKTHLRDLLA